MDCLDFLKRWFLNEKRDLPWRSDPTPYAVWVSEMMLQQTQVSVVVPYFDRWMAKFPSIADLANASLDEVIKLWEGLGYYSRARYLHQGAKTIVELYNGVLPSTPEDLKKIKGLGAYTMGAIRSFAFHERVPAVDGNVLRVLARYFLIEEEIDLPLTRASITKLAESILPQEDSWIINEALIELGATVCKRVPTCLRCPLKKSCQAFLKGRTDELPAKKPRIKTEKLYRAVAIVNCEGWVLVKRGKKGKIMSDLHEFPYLETKEEGIDGNTLKTEIEKQFGVSLTSPQSLVKVQHSFTRFQARLAPVLFQATQQNTVEGYFWIPLLEATQYAFSSGHKRILQQLLTQLF